MVDIIVAIGVGILIGAFGVIAWCVSQRKIREVRMAKNIKTEQGTVTDQEMMEAMRIIGKYCAEHPHCVRCAIISHCGATPPQDWNFSELEVLRNG